MRLWNKCRVMFNRAVRAVWRFANRPGAMPMRCELDEYQRNATPAELAEWLHEIRQAIAASKCQCDRIEPVKYETATMKDKTNKEHFGEAVCYCPECVLKRELLLAQRRLALANAKIGYLEDEIEMADKRIKEPEDEHPLGMRDVPDRNLLLLFDEAAEKAFRAVFLRSVLEVWTITDSHGNAWACSGFAKELHPGAMPVGDCFRRLATFGFSGEPTFTPVDHREEKDREDEIGTVYKPETTDP